MRITAGQRRSQGRIKPPTAQSGAKLKGLGAGRQAPDRSSHPLHSSAKHNPGQNGLVQRIPSCRCGCCRQPLPPEARELVVEWVERVKSQGIRSIVSLLEETQHERYYLRGGLGLHPEGLFGYYRSQGFSFCNIPLTDYQTPSESQMERILEAFDCMPKPVLLQCSAAIDRTSPVAAYIVSKRASGLAPTNE